MIHRAQAIAERSDRTVGRFLRILPHAPGSTATVEPTAAVFRRDLRAAFDSMESEYLLLSRETRIPKAYRDARMRILSLRWSGLQEYLRNTPAWNDQCGPAGSPLRRALGGNGAHNFTESATLPPDPLVLIMSLSYPLGR